jgi:hypothetical protein
MLGSTTVNCIQVFDQLELERGWIGTDMVEKKRHLPKTVSRISKTLLCLEDELFSCGANNLISTF